MTSKAKSKEAATQALAQVAKGIMDEIEADHVDTTDYKLGKTNVAGEMLKAKFTLHPRDKAPNPLCVTVNEEIFWVPRGVEVTVPWYVVTHMKNNIERRFRKEKDAQGKNIVTTYDAPAEPFSYNPISPAAGVEL
jgi:hypothetical protein